MSRLAVAVPWNQSHYIPLSGFHPLYSGLFDPAPFGVDINGWDNVALQNMLANSDDFRNWLLSGLATQADHQGVLHISGFGVENRRLTQMLPGDIELFHSAPFPSLTRPFLLHFESLRSLFSPWAAGSDSVEEKLPLIREYYRNLLGGPLCLGVFSHQPTALTALRDFLGSAQMESRLFTTSIGLPAPEIRFECVLLERPSLSLPRFIFVVTSGHETDFFTCGGHRVLRFWQAFLAGGHSATLTMACERPSPEVLEAAGVDNAFVGRETGHSILWTGSSLAELETLMAGSHVFLQPADVLCTFETLRAMSLGCVPVIAAVQGSTTLLLDNRQGLTVGAEPASAKPWEIPKRTDHEDEQIIQELLRRIPELLAPPLYFALQQAAHQRSMTDFTAKAFAQSFWGRALELYIASKSPTPPVLKAPPIPLSQYLLDAQGLRLAFSMSAHPRLRINTGLYSVWSQGAYFALLKGCPIMATQDWSVVVQYSQSQVEPMVLANSLPELMGRYLPQPVTPLEPKGSETLRLLSRLLMRFPRLHSRCSQWLRQYRRLKKTLSASGANSVESIGHHPSPATPKYKGEPHLVVDGFHGFSIILYDGCFHAVLQSDGALTAERLDKGLYNRCYSDTDLQVVKQFVIAGLAEKGSAVCLDKTMDKGSV